MKIAYRLPVLPAKLLVKVNKERKKNCEETLSKIRQAQFISAIVN